jgi:hypothetical protein
LGWELLGEVCFLNYELFVSGSRVIATDLAASNEVMGRTICSNKSGGCYYSMLDCNEDKIHICFANLYVQQCLGSFWAWSVKILVILNPTGYMLT